MESKYNIYKQVVKCENNYTKNFLDGLLYLNEFSFIYNILKNIEMEVKVMYFFSIYEFKEKWAEMSAQEQQNFFILM